VKLGGSVLAADESYRNAARFLVRRLHRCSSERFVVVVSAQNGQTDELETLARSVTEFPNPRTLDLLWSTGEMRSVALLTLHLEELGVSAVGLNIHETGLRVNGTQEVTHAREEITEALKHHSMVVVPGFFATCPKGSIRSLERGGSDLTAVLLAEALEAQRCELIKDVPGYFSEDPNVRQGARQLPSLTYAEALRMAENGCELVQRRALEAARAARVSLVVRGMEDDAPTTIMETE
jgi:aspartate kinase